MPYIPNTDDDRRQMLARIGVNDVEDLFSVIPDHLRLKRMLDIKPASEVELVREIESLSGKNRGGLTCFAGGGVYDHFIPAAVGSIISRPEFMTAYTPYQAEVSQGTLQVIYEFQTHICRLTGLDVANASMYDGATATAEAVIMASNVTRRKKVIMSETVNPLYREVVKTYLSGRDMELFTIDHKNGLTDLERVIDAIDDGTACVVCGQPNFFGLLEDIEPLAEAVHKVGGKLIMTVDPVAQAILKTPADYGADIAVGEGQPMGMPLSFGGPLLGFFAARKELVRYMPGRIASRTKDVDGREGFVLTLQTREQHIRREKATSNICTNQALCATAASVYLTLLGKTGLEKAALLSAEKAQQTARKLFALNGFEQYFGGSFVREFPLRTPVPAQMMILGAIEAGILCGVNAGRWFKGMDDCLIVAVTEKRTVEDMDRLADILEELAQSDAVSGM